jgi:hypothetical protein
MTVSKLSIASTLVIGLVTVPARANPNQYLCTVEHAAGLHYDKQTNAWRPQEFGPRKYVLRRLTPDDRDEKKGRYSSLLKGNPRANWAFFWYDRSASPMPLVSCVEDRDDAFLATMFFCRTIVIDAEFDSDSRRFEIISHGGYVSQGFWEQFRREHPEQYARQLPSGEAQDPTKPDDLFIEIGTFRACP